MTQSQVARLFRSPELRDLAVLATRQGWEVGLTGGGHILATSPTGATVSMSASAHGSHRSAANCRAALARAGLDLDWTRKGARRQRQEVRSMHVREASATELAPVQVPVQSRDHAPAGGKFRMLGSWEVLTLAGQEVRLGLRADGQWVARHRDATIKRGERTWYGADREALVARVLVALTQESLAPEPEGRLDRVLAVARHEAPAPGSWHVAQVDPEEFPLAAALDALESAVGPAVAALRQAGKADAADLLAVEGGPSNPTERELLALYRRVLRGE